MKLASRCIPLGALPYNNLDNATKMIAKLFEKMPFLALLPHVDSEDTVMRRTLDGIPGIKFDHSEIKIKITSSNYKKNMDKLENAFNHPTLENLEPFGINSVYMEKYFQLIKKFKSSNATINLLGPFSITQILKNVADEQMLVDKNYRKLFVQAVCVKALWCIEKIREISPETTPVVILEEPLYSRLGDLKRENEDITTDIVISLFARVIEKIKEAGAIVGVQCLEKCDWQIPIKAGVDLISFDAYNNPNNLCIIPELIQEFLEKGGMINWGIVPVINEYIVKGLNIDILYKRFFSTVEGLIIAGVPANLVFNSALVSIQGNTDGLPIIFAEKAIILASQLAKRIPVKKEASTDSD